jgi:hypothetical protein
MDGEGSDELAKLGFIVLQVCEELAHGEVLAFLVEGLGGGEVGSGFKVGVDFFLSPITTVTSAV